MRKSDARHVGHILDRLLQRWETGTVKKGDAVREAWGAAIEEEAKQHSRPISLKKGTLLILVENSVWLYELTIKKKNILQKFNESYKGRKKAINIRFRVGKLDD